MIRRVMVSCFEVILERAQCGQIDVWKFAI
jgi:hypothetical protein